MYQHGRQFFAPRRSPCVSETYLTISLFIIYGQDEAWAVERCAIRVVRHRRILQAELRQTDPSVNPEPAPPKALITQRYEGEQTPGCPRPRNLTRDGTKRPPDGR